MVLSVPSAVCSGAAGSPQRPLGDSGSRGAGPGRKLPAAAVPLSVLPVVELPPATEAGGGRLPAPLI